MVPVQVLPGLSMLSKQKLRTVIAVDSVAAVDDINSIRNHVSIKTTQTQKLVKLSQPNLFLLVTSHFFEGVRLFLIFLMLFNTFVSVVGTFVPLDVEDFRN